MSLRPLAHPGPRQEDNPRTLAAGQGASNAADALTDLGLASKAQGELEAAITSFNQALALDPEHLAALVNLAFVLAETGALEEAARAYRRALTLTSDVPEIHYNLGHLLHQQGKRSEAAYCYRLAISLRPDFVEAHNNLGVVLEALGLEEAVASFEQAVALAPDQVDLHLNLADALQQSRRSAAAAARYRCALDLDASCPAAHNGLGIALFNQGQIAAARSCFERAISLKSNYFEAINNLGIACEAQNHLIVAMDHYLSAVEIGVERVDIYVNLGNLFAKLGRVAEAAWCYRRTLALSPGCPAPHNRLGTVFLDQGRLTKARSCFEQALTLDPDYPEAINNLGNVLRSQGRFAEALGCYWRVAQARPDHNYAYSNYLFCLNYDPLQSDHSLSARHLEWGERHGRRAAPSLSYSNTRDPAKTLRVGLLSPDLGRHPIGYFLAPLLASSTSHRIKYYCYSNRSLEDDLTARLRALAHGWRLVKTHSNLELADLIRSDAVDILIDLAGHTAGNRLGCVALRPAPVCVHWGGYRHSIPTVDYSIWDEIQVPAGEERWFGEEIVRLPDVRWCYEAPEYAPPVADPPLLRRKHATFGSFNNLTKVNGAVIELWSRVLKGAPHSRILLSWRTLVDPAECERFRSAFEAHGIAADRVELRPGADRHAGVLGEYAEVDIALDPFPFTGCLTTCEALWMGVPVVTLPRSRPVSRQSQAFLSALGRTEWVARDADDYVRIATTLAADPAGLARLRREQRDRMRASPLCDGPRFARDFEAALRGMWRAWCASRCQTACNMDGVDGPAPGIKLPHAALGRATEGAVRDENCHNRAGSG